MILVCVRCLVNKDWPPEVLNDPDPVPAVTIVNGHALCRDHAVYAWEHQR